MTYKSAAVCPLCGDSGLRPSRFGLLLCASCGLIVNPAIFQKGAADERNKTAFGAGYEPEPSIWVHWFDRLKNRRYLSQLHRAGARTGKLLEVGIGSGSFLAQARAGGFEVTGCDLSEAVCDRVQNALGIQIHCGSLESLPERRWDVVVMNHVLEHVENPLAFLRAARERLRPGGLLHVAVPNAACWEASLPGWNSYERYHVAYFNGPSLDRALRAAGFTPMTQVTHETFSGWLLAILRTLLKPDWRRESSGSRAVPSPHSSMRRLLEHPYRFAMVLGGLLTWPLRHLQGRLGRGDELIVVARA